MVLLLMLAAASRADVALAATPDDAAASVRGTYECNVGSTVTVIPNQPAKIDEYTPSNPLVRVTISTSPKAGLLWWDKSKQIWKEDLSA